MKIEDIAKAAFLKNQLEEVQVPLNIIKKCTLGNRRHGELYNRRVVASVSVSTLSLPMDDDDCVTRLGTFTVDEALVLELMKLREKNLLTELSDLGVEVT